MNKDIVYILILLCFITQGALQIEVEYAVRYYWWDGETTLERFPDNTIEIIPENDLEVYR